MGGLPQQGKDCDGVEHLDVKKGDIRMWYRNVGLSSERMFALFLACLKR